MKTIIAIFILVILYFIDKETNLKIYLWRASFLIIFFYILFLKIEIKLNNKSYYQIIKDKIQNFIKDKFFSNNTDLKILNE